MVLKARENLKAAQLPFKTYNFRNDLSLVIIMSTGICYSEETLALTLIFALKNEVEFPNITCSWSYLLVREKGGGEGDCNGKLPNSRQNVCPLSSGHRGRERERSCGLG